MKIPNNLVVIGLGYVGLPLALAFSKEIPTTGFDLDASRIDELGTGVDRNNEFSKAELTSSKMSLTKDSSCISDAEFIVVTVPTPITDRYEPDLSMLKSASELIGNRLRKRGKNLSPAIVVFESTTYPGCTEGFCAPLIEKASGLKSGLDFFLAYSPERTNFGDGVHTLETVVKVVSGQNPEVVQLVSETYRLVVKAGIHTAKDIKTAEASKLVENIQRDLNIALVNELAVIFDRMNIRSSDVFDAAATKWNFHRYYPGLVGGHCIPVDPYYMTYASSELGYDARVVLAGRDINERMAEFIANRVSGLIRSIKGDQTKASILLLGLAFKPNVSDLRNSKVMALADLLLDRDLVVDVYDPFVRHPFPDDIDYRILENPFSSDKEYDAVVLAVSHDIFLNQKNRIVELVNPGGLVADLVSGLDRSEVQSLGKTYWSL